jgi:hypothetical protein
MLYKKKGRVSNDPPFMILITEHSLETRLEVAFMPSFALVLIFRHIVYNGGVR